MRDENYPRWRFDQHPEHSYKYIIARKGDKLWGYAVVSAQMQTGGLITGLIVDYLIRDEDIDCFRLLMNVRLNELEKTKCDLVAIWGFGRPKFREELVKHLGFKSSLSFPYSKVLREGYFVAQEVKEQILEKIDIYNKANWRVTHAYRDAT